MTQEGLDHLKILEVLLLIIEDYLHLISVMFLLSSEDYLHLNIEECHLKVIKEESTEEECQNQWDIAAITVEMLHLEVQIIEDCLLLQIFEEDHHLIIEDYLLLLISEVDHHLILENLLLIIEECPHLLIIEECLLHLLIIEECHLLLHLIIEECLLQITGGLLLNMAEEWIQGDYHLKN